MLCISYGGFVSIEHQERLDSQRCCPRKLPITMLNAKKSQGVIDAYFPTSGSKVGNLASIAKVKLTWFLAEHNLLFATNEDLISLFKGKFPDSKIAKTYSCSKLEAFCILDSAIVTDLLATLIVQMKKCFSIAAD